MYNIQKGIVLILAISILSVCSCKNRSQQAPLSLFFYYDKPINGYSVSGVFHPFDATSETGQVEVSFIPIEGGSVLTFSNIGKAEIDNPNNPLKFTGKNLCDFVFSDDFTGYHDGDTLLWHYHDIQKEGFNSPILYDAEFQFYDVDFDGEDELLINDYYRGRCGNFYTVYKVTSNGFIEKQERPFTSITNLTEFYPSERRIVDYLYDDTESRYSYFLSQDGSVASTKILSE